MNDNRYQRLDESDCAKIFSKLEAIMLVKRDIDKQIIALQKDRLKPWVEMAKFETKKGGEN